MKDLGWTHKWKRRKNNDKYLKVYAHQTQYEGKPGQTYITLEGQFKWLSHEDVVEI